MRGSSASSARRIPLRITVVYLLVGGLWILLSDRVLEALVQDTPTLAWLQTVKGWFYVGATGLLLYALVRRMLGQVIRSGDALARSREKYRILVEHQRDLLVELDLLGRFVFVGPSFSALFGEPREALEGRTFDAIVVPEDREATLRALVGLSAPPYAVSFDHRAVTPRGPRWLEWSVQAVLDADGQPRGAVGVGRDIEELKRLEEERIRVGALQSLGVMAGGIAHDFNNQLTAVLGNVSLAQRLLDPASPAAARLADVERVLHRARALTGQLLTFAKGGVPVMGPHPVARLVQETATFVTTGSTTRCQFDLPEDLPPLHVDPTQVAQVIQNIVLNAVQAMPGGGTIHVSAREEVRSAGAREPLPEGRYVRLTFADDGPGVDPAVLPRIFDPFFTTRSTGTGLGLATAHAIVARHGGHISAESTPGGGTTFRVWLPVSGAMPSAPEGPVSPPGPRPAGTGRVLLLDDDDDVREVVLQYLGLLGYDAVGVRDGSEAVEVWQSAQEAGRPFDVAILDLRIPGGMGGTAVLSTLRERDPGVVALASSGFADEPADVRTVGFREILPKPYSMDDLRDALARVLASD